jgi:hypothetical protein
MKSRPYTQTELAKGLERWYATRRGMANAGERATWEDDKVFMTLALTLWPVDMESAAHGGYNGDTSRMRLRLRWEGFRALADVRQQMEALLATADYVRQQLQGSVLPVRKK